MRITSTLPKGETILPELIERVGLVLLRSLVIPAGLGLSPIDPCPGCGPTLSQKCWLLSRTIVVTWFLRSNYHKQMWIYLLLPDFSQYETCHLSRNTRISLKITRGDGTFERTTKWRVKHAKMTFAIKVRVYDFICGWWTESDPSWHISPYLPCLPQNKTV